MDSPLQRLPYPHTTINPMPTFSVTVTHTFQITADTA